MPFGLVKFAFSLARISLPHKQLIHLPLGLLHSHKQEEKGFALLQIGWRVLYETAFLLGCNLQPEVGRGDMGDGCMPVPLPNAVGCGDICTGSRIRWIVPMGSREVRALGRAPRGQLISSAGPRPQDTLCDGDSPCVRCARFGPRYSQGLNTELQVPVCAARPTLISKVKSSPAY